jgi:hypothetical protein
MSVVVSYFTKKSREEFLRGSRIALGKKDKLKLAAGTIVVLSSLDEKVVWGVCTLANWTGSDSPCRERHLLDEEVYSQEFAACNKYEIHITNLRILKNPVPFDDVRTLVGGAADFTGPNNMWKGFHCQYATTFISGSEQSSVARFNIWARSLL